MLYQERTLEKRYSTARGFSFCLLHEDVRAMCEAITTAAMILTRKMIDFGVSISSFLTKMCPNSYFGRITAGIQGYLKVSY